MPANSTKLGPGILTVGEVGAEVDISCQLVNGTVEWDKSKDDDTIVLCGDTVAGATTYTATLSGNLLQDLADEAGIVFYSWNNRGEVVPFTFTPNTDAGATVSGRVMLDPIAVGGDEMGAVLASDFTWDIIGHPNIAGAAGGAGAMTFGTRELADV